MKSAQRYSVGHSKRDGLSVKGALNVPGPGNYSMNMSTSSALTLSGNSFLVVTVFVLFEYL